MHILTFDIEHWYEAWRLRNWEGWQGLPDCDSPVVEKLLDVLDETGQKATFFFTGRFAREFPRLVRDCVERGHEAASHSDEHILLTRFSDMDSMRRDVEQSIDSIAQACGVRPKGFRAPKWSILPEMEKDILSLLCMLGIRYDSSFFPNRTLRHKRCQTPHIFQLPEGRSIIEVPATALTFGPLLLPCGGAYFRLFPLAVTQLMLAQCKRNNLPGLMYAHPYDLNPDSHFAPSQSLFFRLMRTIGNKRSWDKLVKLLQKHTFTGVDAWLDAHADRLPEYPAR